MNFEDRPRLFPENPEDPFYAQFDDPFRAYNNLPALFWGYREKTITIPDWAAEKYETLWTDHQQYAYQLARTDHKPGDELPRKWDLLMKGKHP